MVATNVSFVTMVDDDITTSGGSVNSSYNQTSWNKTVHVEQNDSTSDFWQVPQIVFLVVLLLFIVIGNISVLAAISLSENGRKTRMNFFIMHLAIADLSVGLILVPIDIWEKTGIDWTSGDFLCRLREFLKAWVLFGSTYVLVSLSIDRFDAIARPMNFSRRAFRARVLISSAWILAAIFSIPMFVLFGELRTSGSFHGITNITFCAPVIMSQNWHYKLYVTSLAMAAFIIPALIIMVCYSVIIFIIMSKSRTHTQSTPQGTVPRGKEKPGNVVRNIGTSCTVIQQAKIRTIKMTFIIVLVFVLSWTPFFVFSLVQVYYLNEHGSSNKHIRAITALMMSMAPLNSAANPIIYGVFSTRICRNLRRLPGLSVVARYLCCCCDLRRHRMVSRMSHTSVNDGTAFTDGSAKFPSRNGTVVRRTLSETDNSSFVVNRFKHNYIPVQTSSLKEVRKGSNSGFVHKYRPCPVNQHNDDVRGRYKQKTIRRSSGLPLVRRTLSEEDCNLLKSVSIKYPRAQTESNI